MDSWARSLTSPSARACPIPRPSPSLEPGNSDGAPHFSEGCCKHQVYVNVFHSVKVAVLIRFPIANKKYRRSIRPCFPVVVVCVCVWLLLFIILVRRNRCGWSRLAWPAGSKSERHTPSFSCLAIAITSNSLLRNGLLYFFVSSNHILPISTFQKTARDTGGFKMRQASW